MEDNSINIQTQPENSDQFNQTRLTADVQYSSNKSSIIAQKFNINTPLHSYFMFRNCQNNKIGFNESYASNRQKSKLQMSGCQKYKKRKIGFGCSQQRKVDIFQGKKELSQYNRGNCFLNSILSKTFIKSEKNNKILDEIQQRKVDTQQENKIGFGISSPNQRNPILPCQKYYPGPGAYQIEINKSTQKINILHDKKRIKYCNFNYRKSQKQNINKEQEKQLGPGSYTLPNFTSENALFLQKLLKKEKFKDKKLKTKFLLINLHSDHLKKLEIAQKFRLNNQNKRAIMIDNKKKKKQKNQQKKKQKRFQSLTHKLVRNQLKDKTLNFLPKIDESQVNHQYIQIIQKQKYSNSFVMKNDHVFQAHLYKSNQKQSQYIFIKGRQKIKKQKQSPFFKSSLKRQFF